MLATRPTNGSATTSGQASQLAQQLADANKLVAKTNDPAAVDHRDLIAKQLSRPRRRHRRGSIPTATCGSCSTAVRCSSMARTPPQLQTATDPITGYNTVQVVDGNTKRDVTAQVGGSIGADVTFRDTTAKAAADKLDQLAYDTATAFNTQHGANAALDGTTGNNMFVAPTSRRWRGRRARRSTRRSTRIPNKLALASVGGAAGDNTGGLALFALATAKNASGGTQTLTDAALTRRRRPRRRRCQREVRCRARPGRLRSPRHACATRSRASIRRKSSRTSHAFRMRRPR